MGLLVLRVDPGVQVVIGFVKDVSFVIVEFREAQGQPGELLASFHSMHVWQVTSVKKSLHNPS
jgi:hypothetical protein